MPLHKEQNTLPLYVVKVTLKRNLVVCGVSNKLGEEKIGHIFLLWTTEGTKRKANKYKEI